jgi:class 3 adenylate cyclase
LFQTPKGETLRYSGKERMALERERVERRLTAILVADVVGYSNAAEIRITS